MSSARCNAEITRVWRWLLTHKEGPLAEAIGAWLGLLDWHTERCLILRERRKDLPLMETLDGDTENMMRLRDSLETFLLQIDLIAATATLARQRIEEQLGRVDGILENYPAKAAVRQNVV